MQIETSGSDSAPDTTPDTGVDTPDAGGEVETQDTGDEGYVPSDVTEETEADAGAESTEGEEAQPEEAQPPGQPEMSVALLLRAAKAGLDEADIAEANGDPRALELAVRIAERSGGKKDAPAKESPAQGFPALSDVKKALSELQDLGDDVEPSLATAVNTLKGLLSKVVETQEAAFGQLGGTLAQRDHAAAIERFDNALGSLDRAKELFGDGGVDDVDPTSVQFANRQRLWKEMDTLKAAYQSKGEKVPSYNTLLKKAHQLAFGSNLKETVRREMTSAVQSRGKQISSPPSSRKAPPKNASPLEQAYAAARQAVSKK